MADPDQLRTGLRKQGWRVMRLLPGPLRQRLISYVPRPMLYALSWLLMLGMPDRVMLERRIFPLLIQRGVRKVLSVGVAYYTAHHPAFFAGRGVELWTLDLDARKARWGAPHRHVVGDALNLPAHLPAHDFDAVIINGVLGYGIDGEAATTQALRACAAVLGTGGWLIIGWNDDKSGDPLLLPEAGMLFRPVPLHGEAARVRVSGDTMVYDFLEKVG